MLLLVKIFRYHQKWRWVGGGLGSPREGILCGSPQVAELPLQRHVSGNFITKLLVNAEETPPPWSLRLEKITIFLVSNCPPRIQIDNVTFTYS